MKSKIITNCLNPKWDNERLHLSWNRKDYLILHVYDHGTNKSLGDCEVELEKFLEGFHTQGKLMFDYNLKNISHGTIQFEIEFVNLK